jgi:hypothetical protein
MCPYKTTIQAYRRHKSDMNSLILTLSADAVIQFPLMSLHQQGNAQ